MDIRTAIENLKHIVSEIRFDTSVREIKQIKRDKIKSIDMAIMALEKQIPNPVVYEGDGYADGVMVYDMAYCPVCDHAFEEGCAGWKSKFCPNCGQALDWSEDEGEEEK